MSHEILQKFEDLRERRAIIESGPHPRVSVEIVDRLSAELEEWARTADAGEVLAQVCAAWVGWRADLLPLNVNPSICTDPSSGMELLEAAGRADEDMALEPDEGRWVVSLPKHHGSWSGVWGDSPSLAIARACAVLAARGIEPQGGDA